MGLPEKWASAEDFATLFQYFWHRDFPMHQLAPGARRVDWTIHIGIVVRNIADLTGLMARFESGGKKDAVLRSGDGDEIAIEWEWGGVWGNELCKLKDERKIWRKDGQNKIQYAVLITYTHDIDTAYKKVAEQWQGAQWPLLLILIDVEKEKAKILTSRRKFINIQMSVFDKDGQRELRTAPALPWEVNGTRWSLKVVT